MKTNLIVVVFLIFALQGISPSFAGSGDFIRNTYLIELNQGSQLSQTARAAGNGGFETANGRWIGLRSWYSSSWTDSQFAMMTQMTPWFGIVWGAGTGEYGQKYTIDPSIKIGFVMRTEISRNSSLSFKATALIGGALREKACSADYGAIGGVQQVNCRLAASTIAPADTLQYMYNMSPLNPFLFSLNYQISF